MNTRIVLFNRPVSRSACRTVATPSSTESSARHWFVGSVVPMYCRCWAVMRALVLTGLGLSATSASLNDGLFDVVIPSHRGSVAYFGAGFDGACGARYER